MHSNDMRRTHHEISLESSSGLKNAIDPHMVERADPFFAAMAEFRAGHPIQNKRLRKILLELRQLDFEAAGTKLNEYLIAHPDDPDALRRMAEVKTHFGKHMEAVSLLNRCLDLAPDFALARWERARLLDRRNEYAPALKDLDWLLAQDGGNPVVRQLKAAVLAKIGKNEQARKIFQELATEHPRRAEVWVSYGHALTTHGLRDESIAAFRKAIECRPSYGMAYWSLANLKTYRFTESELSAIEEQLRRNDISSDDRITLQFALGKAYENYLAFDKAYAAYAKANASMRLRIQYDVDKITSRVASNKSLFTPDFIKTRKGAGSAAYGPIFVLGQPRSGSTLIEQILSSHSAVEGVGELPYIAELAKRLMEEEGVPGGTPYPELLGKLDPAAFRILAEKYLEHVQIHRKLERPFFVDKKPANFWHIGMIHLILPNAKIIDARRHPVACSVSGFRQFFGKTNLRLTEAGRLYRDYVELMAHFDRVLPGKIHRVIYENMVSDPENEVRELLRYLDLPFEPNCLRFYETERSVSTPSSEQVRKPISSDAVNYWHNYQPWLGPLIKSLGSVFASYPQIPEEF